ncbi:MAG: LysR family transcriptional regulator [Ruminococcus sp.]|jgi:DNA-binding transcriptional LysR family regulator
MIEIFLLEQFIAFVQNGTLSRAAEELHISQPALSRSMKKLEDEFGVSLFERGRSKIVLNDTGKIAAEYARKVLEADREMMEKTLAFERSRCTIIFGSCASLPANKLIPIIQENFCQMAITSEVSGDDKLIEGLKKRVYHLAILHKLPGDEEIFYRKFMDERLAVTLPSNHPLAAKKSISFQDLQGISILAHGGSGFWLEICRKHLKETKLLVQESMGTLSELVDASTLPVFNSDKAMQLRDTTNGRVTIPISDDSASITYYLACLKSEKGKYSGIFNAICSENFKRQEG